MRAFAVSFEGRQGHERRRSRAGYRAVRQHTPRHLFPKHAPLKRRAAGFSSRAAASGRPCL